ncbi:MAG: hypothetical protein V2A53_06870 [bacterium]
MKSQVKRPKIDNLVFQWDHKATTSLDIKKNDSIEYNKHRLIDEYFDLLAEIKPHKQELSNIKMFEIPFTLP